MLRQLKAITPKPIIEAYHKINDAMGSHAIRHMDIPRLRKVMRDNDLNVHKLSDFYSPLTDVEELQKNVERWYKPSAMAGVKYDLDRFRDRIKKIYGAYYEDFKTIPSHDELRAKNYGPGFPIVDQEMVYLMVRDLKPKRYIEVGSGLSTITAYYAVKKNIEEGHPCTMTVIDPYPFDALKTEFSDVDLRVSMVQDIDLSLFEECGEGDIFFIDTTHILKPDSDVHYMFMEVLPRIGTGVTVHVHDIPFPYNVPYPAEQFIFEWYNHRWPMLWNEPPLVQAFLMFNDSFEIEVSAPMLRHFDEDFLKQTIPNYRPVQLDDYRTHFGSIWMKRVK
jgi:hypothetical protein